MAFEVFISYSTRDLTRATQVSGLLERPGCNVFLAEYSIAPGEPLDATIMAAIQRCDVFILLWSHRPKASEWVAQEIGIAKAHGCPIVPIALHKSAVPAGFLRGTKYLRLYEDPSRNLAWLQQHVFEAATKKEQQQGLVWLGLGAAFLWLLNQDQQKRGA